MKPPHKDDIDTSAAGLLEELSATVQAGRLVELLKGDGLTKSTVEELLRPESVSRLKSILTDELFPECDRGAQAHELARGLCFAGTEVQYERVVRVKYAMESSGPDSGARASGRCESMKLNVRQIGHVAVIDLAGNIAVGNGDAVLRDGVFELLQSDQKQILLNMQKVPYIDSTGIGEMVACYKAARDENGMIKLLNPSEKVSQLLQITRLEEVFETYRNEEEALRSF